MEKPIQILMQPKTKRKWTKFTTEAFIRGYVNGQEFIILPEIREEHDFESIAINIEDFLTSAEIEDVNMSLREIEEGKAKKFESVDKFLEELKE